MLNLFEIATNNAPELDDRFSALSSTASPGLGSSLRKFSELVRHHGRVTINMRPMSFLSFLVNGCHQNMYEWAQSRAAESGRPVEEIIQERLGDFYGNRTSFDRSFVNGEAFRYGALNVGGPGVSVYGDYCIVVRNLLFEATHASAYLRSDSLKTYMRVDGTLDEPLLLKETSPHSHRHVFAGLKHASDLGSAAEEQWPVLLCSKTEFIEVVFSSELKLSGIEAVRLEANLYRELFEFGFENFRVKLTDERRFVFEAFVMIKKILRENKIPLEVAKSA